MSLTDALSLTWAFGFNKDKVNGTASLCINERNALFFISSHSAVIYDFEHRTQTILQGHCNIISCCVVDRNKRWIVTSDIGIDPILVVWDAISYVPVKTYPLPTLGGIVAVDISDDALYIATISVPNPDYSSLQEIAIWAWTIESSEPILRKQIAVDDYQCAVRFDKINPCHVVSTGYKTTLFWAWNDFDLTFYNGKVSKSDLGAFEGDYITSIFLPMTENALTATSEGYVIVWESVVDENQPDEVKNSSIKNATKVLKLVEGGIKTFDTTVNNYLVIACEDGAVRFYDYFLRLEAWFEDLNAGPITSISFSVQTCPYQYGDAGVPGLKFWVPDFIVGTADGFVVGVESSIFDEVKRDDRRGTLLMQGMSDQVITLCCHPFLALVAVACGDGMLQVWNYEMKLLMILREFNVFIKPEDRKLSIAKTRVTLVPSCLSFDATGKFLAVGFTSGLVKLLYSHNLEDLSQYVPSSESIVNIKFSVSGNYLAAYDTSRHVILFRREEVKVPVSTPTPARSPPKPVVMTTEISFTYVGRSRSHSAPITGLAFGYKDGMETLISISEDQHCVEYDLNFSTVTLGVLCLKSINVQGRAVSSSCIELTAKPTAIVWHPKLKGDLEDRFVIVNDVFKFKQLNVDSKICRRVTLAPKFGTPPNVLINVPASDAVPKNQAPTSSFLAFSTASRVIGLTKFPLTGDPSETMGIVAHPGDITGIDVSFDGKYLFSAGGADLSVNMWKINPNHTGDLYSDSEYDPPRDSMKPFYSLLEGGEGGELHRDIEDYFYYCQLRHLGEDSMESRTLTGKIPLEEIPSLFRAVGFYPSESEVSDMMGEVRYKTFVNTGETQDFVELDEVIQLYVNHRPVLPLEKQYISSAFKSICETLIGGGSKIPWDVLKDCLLTEGEGISANDLDAYLVALTGKDSESIHRNQLFGDKTFAEELLGFEDFIAAGAPYK